MDKIHSNIKKFDNVSMIPGSKLSVDRKYQKKKTGKITKN